MTIEQAIKTREQEFYTGRAQMKSEVDRFLASLEELEPEEQEKLKVVAGRKTEDILPSLWATPFVEETYNQELAKLCAYIEAVQRVQAVYLREAENALR